MIALNGVALWGLPNPILSKRKQTKVLPKTIRHSNKKGGKIQTSEKDNYLYTGDYKSFLAIK